MERKNTKVKGIAFDLGNVLFRFDYSLALDKIRDKIDISTEEVMSILYNDGFSLDFERGLITAGEFYRVFQDKSGCKLSYEDFVLIWNDIFDLNRETYHLVKSLKPFYHLCLISNINQLHYHFLKEKYPEVFTAFDTEILSFKEKQIKPSKEIYESLFLQAGLSKEEVVYIDDRDDLVLAAREIGIKSIRFIDTRQCKKELESFRVTVPTGKENILFHQVRSFLDTKGSALVGLGNKFQADDSSGSELADRLKDKIKIKVFNPGLTPENIPLRELKGVKRLLVIDSSKKLQDNFELRGLEDILSLNPFSTHTSLIFFEFLKEYTGLDIMFFLLKAETFGLGQAISPDAEARRIFAENFFLKNFKVVS